MNYPRWLNALIFGGLLSGLHHAQALELQVSDDRGEPIAGAMVRVQSTAPPSPANWSAAPSNPASGRVLPQFTWFTDAHGRLSTGPLPFDPLQLQVRYPGYQEAVLTSLPAAAVQRLTLAKETDPAALAASRPANAWFAELDLGDPDLKKHFALQCAFCHQQGNAFTRRERSSAEWEEVIARMITYGSRLSSAAQKTLPQQLSSEFRRLRENPGQIQAATPWPAELAQVRITEWPIGDSLSQMHDLLTHSNGLVYVGDNLKDDLYEIDPTTGAYRIYKLPHGPDDELGGLLGARLKAFPKHETYVGLHSFAESEHDGHIFMTCSVQRRLIEFAPETKQFTVHKFAQGLYPHTLRIDRQDRVWFTLALSNQIGVLDRQTGKFAFIDLPSRSLKERLTIALVRPILKLADWGVPLNRLPIDFQSSGLPLPYGIEVTPDGNIWFARLYADDIGRIDAESLEVTMYPTPLAAPRRLRADAQGNLWIAAFSESAILKFEPGSERFTSYPLPVKPAGSDTPYSLNVDRARGIVWVDGNQSDSGLAFDIASEQWLFIPLPRTVSFTRDFEITPDGSAWTSNSSFPSWHIEGGQPTLIRIEAQSALMR